MTGHFPAWHHYHFNPKGAALFPDGSPARYLDPEIPNITSTLRTAGYVTGHFGKWHLGYPEKTSSPNPSEYGIDVHRTHMTHHEPHLPRYWDLHDGDISTFWSRLTTLIVDDAIQFMEDHQDRPFYMNVWTWLPHAILNPTAEQMEPYQKHMPPKPYTNHPGALAIYYASVADLDAQIGRLIDRIDAMGLAENTLVVFSSDNGPEDIHVRDSTHSGVGSTGPFRGRKRSIHEGGIRVPLIVRQPGRIPAGRVDHHSIVCGVDFLPTFCHVAEAQIPRGHRLDGENVMDAFYGEARKRTKPLFWRDPLADLPPSGHVLNKSPILAVREGAWKLMMNPDGSRTQLYDIPNDPSEMNNLAHEKPALVKAMKRRLLQWHRSLPTSDRRIENYRPARHDWKWPGQGKHSLSPRPEKQSRG
jgi:arylsulfatase A-like enzyme